MKFGQARNDNIYCKHCGGNLLYGEEYVAIFWTVGTIRRSMFFHVDCYPIWIAMAYQKKLEAWRKGQKKATPKRGRPKKWTNPGRVNKLQRLIRYHAEQGHTDMVRVLEKQLTAYEVK